MRSVESLEKELMAPRYSFAEADRLAGVGRGTSLRWLKGYSYRDDRYAPGELRFQPPVGGAPFNLEAVSFIDLIEIIVINGLRAKGFSPRTVRKINAYCQVLLNQTRPLVTETFRVSGKDVFIQMSEHDFLVNVSRKQGMQAWEEILEPFLQTVDFEDELARRWWPLGRSMPVVVDPDYGFGFPVVQNTGVRTEIVAERARAGDSLEDIAYDFDLDGEQVKAALTYERATLAA